MEVVAHGSFAAASRATGIAKSTLSQRICALEEAVGTAVLRRNSRSLSLTKAGEVLLPHARAIDDMAKSAETALLERGRELGGTLRITTSFFLAQFTLAPLLANFLKRHPKVAIQIDATDRYVDIISEGYDMAVRGHSKPLQDSELTQRIVAKDTPWVLFATPRWIAENEPIRSPRDISGKDVLYWTVTGERPSWTLHKGRDHETISLKPRVITAELATLRNATLAGSGISALPYDSCWTALKSGDLVHVLPGWHLVKSTISVLTPPRRQVSRLAKAFSDYFAMEIGTVDVILENSRKK
jgi:DNA-binding transcriptional LysR family regulator